MKVKKRGKQIWLVTSNKTEVYKKWCVTHKILLVILLVYENYTGWVWRGFFVCLFVCMFVLMCSIFVQCI